MAIECINFKPYTKGSLRGFCELYLPTVGLTISNVSLLENSNGEKWVSMPSRAYEDKEGVTKYSPYIRFDDRTHKIFQQQALTAIGNYLRTQSPKQEEKIDDNEIPF